MGARRAAPREDFRAQRKRRLFLGRLEPSQHDLAFRDVPRGIDGCIGYSDDRAAAVFPGNAELSAAVCRIRTSTEKIENTMKAVYIEQTGGPEVLKYGDLPTPEAGPGQALVKLAASGVN